MCVVEIIFKPALADTTIKTPTDSFSVKSKLNCFHVCLSLSWCVALSYSEDSGACEISETRYLKNDTTNLISGNGWNYYQAFADECPVESNYVLVKPPIGLCYKVYTNETLPHDSAVSVCENDGGFLLKLDTTEKINYIKNMSDSGSIDGIFHIGLEKRNISETWEWSDGTSTVPEYWHPGQPDNIAVENCVVMVKSYGYRWSDVGCERKFNFVCEIRLY